MGFALALRELSAHRRLLALGAVVAVFVATLSVYHLDGFGLKSRSLQYSAASTQVLVDSDSSALGNLAESFESLANRAVVYADFMTNPSILEKIGQQVGLKGGQIYAVGPVTGATRVEQEPTALKRNVELTGETKPYRLNFESQNNLPTININAQAPTTKQAVALANAAALAMHRYVAEDVSVGAIAPPSRVVIRQLGAANGAVVDGGISKQLFVIVFGLVFTLWCVLMLAVPRALAMWRDSATPERQRQRRGRRQRRRRGRGRRQRKRQRQRQRDAASPQADRTLGDNELRRLNRPPSTSSTTTSISWTTRSRPPASVPRRQACAAGKRALRAPEDAEVASATGPVK